MKHSGGRNLSGSRRASGILVLLLIGLTPAARAFERDLPVPKKVKSPIVTIRNVGISGILSPRVLLNTEPDFVSVEAMARDVCRSASTEQEKAEALWDFVRRRTDHICPNTTYPGMEVYDPLTILNERGYGCCDQVTQTLAILWAAAGLKSRLAMMSFHTVSEVFYEEGWHLYDPDHEVYYLLEDGRTVASVWQVARSPARVAQTPDPTGYEAAWMASKYESEGLKAQYTDVSGSAPADSFWLPPRSRLTFSAWPSVLTKSSLTPVLASSPPDFSEVQFHGVLRFGDPGWPVFLRATEVRDGRLTLVPGAARGMAVVEVAGPGAALTGSLNLPYELGGDARVRVWVSGSPDLSGRPLAEAAGPKSGVLRVSLRNPLGSLRLRRFFVGIELEGNPSSARVGPDLEIATAMQWSFSALEPQRSGITAARYQDDSGEIARDVVVTIGNRPQSLKSTGGTSFWESESSADNGRAGWRGYLQNPTDEVRERLPVPDGQPPAACELLALVSGSAAEKDQASFDAVFSLAGQVILTTPVPSLLGIRWLRVPFEPGLLLGKKDVEARISLTGAAMNATGYLEVFGSGTPSRQSTFNGQSDDLSRDPGPQRGEFMLRIRCQGPWS